MKDSSATRPLGPAKVLTQKETKLQRTIRVLRFSWEQPRKIEQQRSAINELPIRGCLTETGSKTPAVAGLATPDIAFENRKMGSVGLGG